MSEHSQEETKALALIFLEEYNKANMTTFRWAEGKSYQPREPFDFSLYENKRELGVQIIRAVSDPEREFIQYKRVEKIVDPIKQSLEKIGLPGLFVYLNFHNLPNGKEEIDATKYWLEQFIIHKVKPSAPKYYFTYDSEDTIYLSKLLKNLNDIKIMSLPSIPRSKVIFVSGTSYKDTEPWPSDTERVAAAVKKKEQLYVDVILLIDSGTFPFSDFYIPEIRGAVAQSRLDEIWLVDNFSSQQRALKIK